MITCFKYNREIYSQQWRVGRGGAGDVQGAWLLGGRGVLMGDRMGEAGTAPGPAITLPPAPPVGEPELMLDMRPCSFTTG